MARLRSILKGRPLCSLSLDAGCQQMYMDMSWENSHVSSLHGFVPSDGRIHHPWALHSHIVISQTKSQMAHHCASNTITVQSAHEITAEPLHIHRTCSAQAQRTTVLCLPPCIQHWMQSALTEPGLICGTWSVQARRTTVLYSPGPPHTLC